MPIPSGGLMNNGRADTGVKDVQKLQQQLQDIKDQVQGSDLSVIEMIMN